MLYSGNGDCLKCFQYHLRCNDIYKMKWDTPKKKSWTIDSAIYGILSGALSFKAERVAQIPKIDLCRTTIIHLFYEEFKCNKVFRCKNIPNGNNLAVLPHSPLCRGWSRTFDWHECLFKTHSLEYVLPSLPHTGPIELRQSLEHEHFVLPLDRTMHLALNEHVTFEQGATRQQIGRRSLLVLNELCIGNANKKEILRKRS